MSNSKTDLLQIIDKQSHELEKYKKKLRDVVAVHKILIEEKNALQQTLNVLQEKANRKEEENGEITGNETEDAKQVAVLVTSLNTLTEGKAKLEASFQSDKKQLREEKESAELLRDELQKKVLQFELEIENLRSQVIIERHERDKEQSDHGIIMKELQNILGLERKQRLKLEEEMTELKKRSGDISLKSVDKHKRRSDALEAELKVTRRKLELTENKSKEPSPELLKLREDVRNIRAEYQTALEYERQKGEEIEERSKKQALVQEERIYSLESRLAELSASVGMYDRVRQHDKSEILQLKDYIAGISLGHQTDDNHTSEMLNDSAESAGGNRNIEFPPELLDKDIHSHCTEEIELLRKELDSYKSAMLKYTANGGKDHDGDGVMRNLQERLRVMNEELNIKEKHYSVEVEKYKQMLRAEKIRAKETLATADKDYRSRLNLLETQIQKLRERSMAMLEDKEQEIHSLQGTFQTLVPGTRPKESTELPSLTSMRDGPRMLHYASELARRDVDITALRRSKHKLETVLRDLQRAAATDAEAYHSERKNLQQEVARLERSQARGGANLEYLKNVVLNFLISTDPCSKRRMANAIAAVLKFSSEEQDKISKQSHNSWWSNKS